MPVLRTRGIRKLSDNADHSSKRENKKKRVRTKIGAARKSDNASSKGAHVLDPKAAWAALPFEIQMRIVREIVDTRQHELVRAYPQVLRIMAGVKRTNDKRKDAALLKKPAPAVIFVVSKKAPKAKLKDDLIRPLLHYCIVNRHRLLCEIPVDVEDQRRYARISLHTNPDNVDVNGEIGCVTCEVEIPGDENGGDSQPAVLSCRHVFHTRNKRVMCGSKRIGPVKYHGRLSSSGLSHDIALCLLDEDPGALSQALGALFLGSWATDDDDIPKEYYIRTPRGPIRVAYRADFDEPIDYDGIGPVRQKLIESRVLGGTIPVGGDSGAPVVSKPNGGRLLGIHIAGNGGDAAFMVPAWFALKTNFYETSGLPKDELLRLP